MKQIYSTTFSFLLLCSFFTNALGQTVVWEMPPSAKYSSIVPLGIENLFRVTQEDKLGVVKADGTVIVRAENDEITSFYEGTALILKNDGYGKRIQGFITKEGKYLALTQRYYAIEGQEFFSDGMLTARNDHSFPGYLDSYGREALGFNSEYDVVKPFSEGYATVFKRNKYMLIDKSGIVQPIKLKKETDVIAGGTNVFRGIAYVWNSTGKFFTFDVNTKIQCRKVRKPASTQMDYLYRFKTITRSSEQVPYDKEQLSPNSLQTSIINGKIGYKNDELTVVPAQFTEGSPFYNDLAVVEKEGMRGILRYVPKDKWVIKTKNEGNVYYTPNVTETKGYFEIEIPNTWKEKYFEVTVTDADTEKDMQAFQQNQLYFFTCQVPKSEQKEWIIAIVSHGVKIYEERVTLYFVKACPSCQKLIEECPYKGKHPKLKRKNSTHKKKPLKANLCKTCGLPENTCPYKGIH